VLIYSFVVTYILGTIVKKTIGFRVSEDDERAGIDLAEHAETAYDFSTISGGSRSHLLSRSAPPEEELPAKEEAPVAEAADDKEGSVAR
jgi:Amt family ammonium transporter